MKTTEFLDALKARQGLPSDYAAAKFIGLTQAQISRYRTGKDFLSDTIAIKVAAWLDMPPGYVLACVHAERASDDTIARVWAKMANTMRKAGAATASGLLLSALLTTSPDALASQHQGKSGLRGTALYIMSTRFCRLLKARCIAFFSALYHRPRPLTLEPCMSQ